MLKMLALLSLVSAAVAQSGTTVANTMKRTTPPAHSGANSPIKVSGEPTKAADGLEYWDIEVGTGASPKPERP
jgi:hypothetical protein